MELGWENDKDRKEIEKILDRMWQTMPDLSLSWRDAVPVEECLRALTEYVKKTKLKVREEMERTHRHSISG